MATGCSDHERLRFRILKGENKAKSHITALEFRTADFGWQRATRIKEGPRNLPYGGNVRVVSVQPGEETG